MPLTKAQCTNCGANLEVDSSKEAAVCPYCGAAYIVEKAVNQYSMNFNGVVNMNMPDNKEQLFENGYSQIKLKEYNSAFETFSDLSKKYSSDWRSWDGLLRAVTMDKYFSFRDFRVRNDIQKYYSNLKALSSEKSAEWSEYIGKYEENYQKLLKSLKNEKQQMEEAVRSSQESVKTYSLISYVSLVAFIISFIGIVSVSSLASQVINFLAGAFCMISLAAFIAFTLVRLSKEPSIREKEKTLSDFINNAQNEYNISLD